MVLSGLLLMCGGHWGWRGTAGVELQSFLSVAFTPLIAQGWRILRRTRYFPRNEGAGALNFASCFQMTPIQGRHGTCLRMPNSGYLTDGFSCAWVLPDDHPGLVS